MKITEMRCSACDGTLKLDESNPKRAVCQYCRTEYIIEWDADQISGFSAADGSEAGTPGRPANGPNGLGVHPSKMNWQPGMFSGRTGTPAGRVNTPAAGQSQRFGGKAIMFSILFMAALYGVAAVIFMSDRPSRKAQADVSVETAVAKASEAAEEEVHPTGILAAAAEQIFEMPVEDIPADSLAKIKWLETRGTMDTYDIGYSFEDPLENPEAELTWLSFSRDGYQLSLSSLPAFTGVKRVKASSLRQEDIKGLKLTGIDGYFDSLEGVAAMVDSPELLRDIGLTGQTMDLSGIEAFPALERLSLRGDAIENERELVKAENLKCLELDMYDGTMEFSSLGALTGLEELVISSQNVRDIGFVSGMASLKRLSLEYGEFLSLAPIGERGDLEELVIDSCDEIKDMSVVSGLVKLKNLRLELPYGCPEPDLSSLTGLEELYLDGFEQTGFLRGMSGLTKLTLYGCQISNESDFEGLASLKELTCSSFTAVARDYGFITRLPALETLNMAGTATYEDISGIFNMPTLRELSINGMSCEIAFDKVNENTTLEHFSIDHIKLYKNVKVSGGGGIVYVDWDDVKLEENLDFLKKFQGLKELSIRENNLTDLSFAGDLPALQSIDFGDNYVTDLSPLTGLKNMQLVNCEQNPISNYRVLGEKVTVIQ